MTIVGEMWEEEYNLLKKQLEGRIAELEGKLAEKDKELEQARKASAPASPFGSVTEEPGVTDASKALLGELGKILRPGSRWRSGALLLTYHKPGAETDSVNIANAVASSHLTTVNDALHLIKLCQGMRLVADQLDATLACKKPLPDRTLGQHFRAKRRR